MWDALTAHQGLAMGPGSMAFSCFKPFGINVPFNTKRFDLMEQMGKCCYLFFLLVKFFRNIIGKWIEKLNYRGYY